MLTKVCGRFPWFHLPELRFAWIVYEIAQKYGIKAEDASHSPGSYCETDRTLIHSASCEFSDAACLSFHPVKHICCGEGGAVLTNHEDIANSVRRLRSHELSVPITKTMNHHGFINKMN